MDQPGLDEAAHRQALRGLRRINAVSRTDLAIWRHVAVAARGVAPGRLRVLDLATGGGDVPIALATRARRAGLAVDFAGCDRSGTAVAHAAASARRAGVTIDFFPLDVLAEPLPRAYDVLICSLFLHHLRCEDAVTLLRSMRSAAGRLMVVDDLHRSAAGWLLTEVGVRVLSRSPIVHIDGPRSLRAAFRVGEAAELATESGWTNFSIRRRWPSRFLLVGRP
jgi:2-polyprenyl-3-methyl-5-hydroxy-6-metoxy-1,4-benzoquinol methylase